MTKFYTIEKRESLLQQAASLLPFRKKQDPGYTLTSLDKTILAKAKEGEDIMGIINACRPYTNSYGDKAFARKEIILGSVKKLVRLGLLRRVV